MLDVIAANQFPSRWICNTTEHFAKLCGGDYIRVFCVKPFIIFSVFHKIISSQIDVVNNGETDIMLLLNQIESWQILFSSLQHPSKLQKTIAKQGENGGMRRKTKAVFWCRLKLDNFGICHYLCILSGPKSPKLSNWGWILPKRSNDLKFLLCDYLLVVLPHIGSSPTWPTIQKGGLLVEAAQHN